MNEVVERLAEVGGVVAVALGGSRAAGNETADSDWDFGVYYRGRLDTDAVRAVGWEGQVFEPGDWGGGVFNGGAWLRIDGQKVDLIYRDLDDVERRLADAERGEFSREYLAFYLCGIPTYVVVGELALNRVLHGSLPRPDYPDALSRVAVERWHDSAVMTLNLAARSHAARRDAVATAGNLARAILEESHSRLAARKEWVLNEKRLAERAGLSDVFNLSTVGGSLDSACDAVADAIGG